MNETRSDLAPPPSTSPRLLIRRRAGVRAVYLWAGDATIDLQRVKFPDIEVDEDAHRAAHAPEAAAALADAGFNWAFLSMNWGFPPERERGHWEQFADAVRVYRDAGFHVLGYVQASNCVARGSYAAKDWYARTWRGSTVPYFRDRLMTCWNHPDWVAEVGAHAVRVMDAGAHGVFFDNVWMGATPWVMGLKVGGFAGCACQRCRSRFRAASGHPIPRRLGDDDASARYLQWRAGIVGRRLRDWAARVRVRFPEAVILVNSCDAALRDTRALFGYDLPAASRVQDALLVENVAMPRYDQAGGRLVANALALKAVQAAAPDRTILSITYENGIGLDGAPHPRRLRRTVAETLAVGGAPVVKGSEYLDSRRRFSVLTAPDMTTTRESAAAILRWAADNPALFQGDPDPEVEVAMDVDPARTAWAEATPGGLALGLALIREGVPFRFVCPGTPRDGSDPDRPLLVPPGQGTPAKAEPARGLAAAANLLRPRGAGLRLAHHPWARAVAHPFLTLVSRLYFGSARVRRLIDGTGLTRWFLRSPFFALPAGSRAVIERIGERRAPWVTPEGPVLVERFRDGDRTILHLVNYGDDPVRVVIHHDRPPHVHTPDPGTRLVIEAPLVPPSLRLDTYAVLTWADADQRP